MTALMISSRNGHVVVLDTLLKHGASVDFKKKVRIASLYPEYECEESAFIVSFLIYQLVRSESLLILPASIIASLINVHIDLVFN